jgi:DNA modification methylase
VTITLDRQIEIMPVTQLRSAKRNARTHSKQQVSQVARSIEHFGFTNPILVADDYTVVAGHCRLAAAAELGLTEVPCIRLSGMSAADRRAYLIADNQLALRSGWDVEILSGELADLMAEDFDMTLTGYDLYEIDSILVDADEASVKPSGPEDQHPTPPNPKDIVTRLDDQYQLGRHTLLCGDAKDAATISQVMGDEKADMVFTDPPYNLRIPGHVSGLGRKRHGNFAEASGEMSVVEFTAFLRVSLEAMEQACRNGAIVYTCMDWRHLGELLTAGNAIFSELKNICMWKKSNAGKGAFYRSQHEMVLVWKIGDAPHINNFGLGDKGRHRTNVWSYPGVTSFGSDRMAELSSHPTVKPVALVADALRDVSNRGDIVLDPFGGSGTTLIAAEKTGRSARMVEIDPAYCDVIIRRWERLTGKKALLIATGQTFDVVEADRLETAAIKEEVVA